MLFFEMKIIDNNHRVIKYLLTIIIYKINDLVYLYSRRKWRKRIDMIKIRLNTLYQIDDRRLTTYSAVQFFQTNFAFSKI